MEKEFDVKLLVTYMTGVHSIIDKINHKLVEEFVGLPPAGIYEIRCEFKLIQQCDLNKTAVDIVSTKLISRIAEE